MKRNLKEQIDEWLDARLLELVREHDAGKKPIYKRPLHNGNIHQHLWLRRDRPSHDAAQNTPKFHYYYYYRLTRTEQQACIRKSINRLAARNATMITEIVDA